MRLHASLVVASLALVAGTLRAEDRRFDELDSLRLESIQKRAAAVDLARRGTRALEEGDNAAAATLLAEAAAVTSALAPIAGRAGDLVAAIVSECVVDLESDSFAVREKASEKLCCLDPRALPALEAARARLGPEGRHRLIEIIGVVKSMDEDGRLHQWAVGARASSEYTDTSWSAEQATGEPDTLKDGDLSTAWASKEKDAGAEWLELDYATEVRPLTVRIHETFNPGAVVKVEAMASDEWVVLWEGKDGTAVSPGWLEVPVTCNAPIRKLRVTLDTASVPGWNEIDAVELVGRPRPPR